MNHCTQPDRRTFLRQLSVGSAGLALAAGGLFTSRRLCAAVPAPDGFGDLTRLLTPSPVSPPQKGISYE